MMEKMSKTYSQVLRELSEARVKLETAKKLIGRMPVPDIADVTGLPLEQIEQLAGNPS